MLPLSKAKVRRIRELRRTGHSLPEIKRMVKCGAGTVFRYIEDVVVAQEYAQLLKAKQGGSRVRSDFEWEKARKQSAGLLGLLSSRDKLLVLAALYWGEGTKSELNIINGDSSLLRVFIVCLQQIGIGKERLRISLRLFEDIDKRMAIAYWAEKLQIHPATIHVSELSKGKKNGKLPFGMCRIRVAKNGPYFKLIMSMIESIRAQLSPRSSMDRTAAS